MTGSGSRRCGELAGQAQVDAPASTASSGTARRPSDAGKAAHAGRGWWVAFLVLLVVHLVALYWPRIVLDGAPQDSDKLAHLLLYGLPTFVGVVAAGRWWPAALLALHAPVSEVLQAGLLPGRSGSVADGLADLLGVTLGMLLAWVYLHRRAQRGADLLAGADRTARR